MNNYPLFLRADDVAQILGVSKPKAYVIMKCLNDSLKAKGMIVTSGRLSTAYFFERCVYNYKGENTNAGIQK